MQEEVGSGPNDLVVASRLFNELSDDELQEIIADWIGSQPYF